QDVAVAGDDVQLPERAAPVRVDDLQPLALQPLAREPLTVAPDLVLRSHATTSATHARAPGGAPPRAPRGCCGRGCIGAHLWTTPRGCPPPRTAADRLGGAERRRQRRGMTTAAPTARTTQRPPLRLTLGLPWPVLAVLVALAAPRVVVHDLALVAPDSSLTGVLALVPLAVWVLVAALWSPRPAV